MKMGKDRKRHLSWGIRTFLRKRVLKIGEMLKIQQRESTVKLPLLLVPILTEEENCISR
jgi:hypothetical protein